MGDIVRKKFQCDIPAKAAVLVFINNAHATAAELNFNGVMGTIASEDEGQICHRHMNVTPAVEMRQSSAETGISSTKISSTMVSSNKGYSSEA